MCLKGTKVCHKDQAGVWAPPTKIAILAVSLAEQADIDLYVDFEVSTKPDDVHVRGQRLEGLHRAREVRGTRVCSTTAPTSGNTYLGSNVTTTHIAFPDGYGIMVDKGVADLRPPRRDQREPDRHEGRPGRLALLRAGR